ncbi:MAG: DUF1905 domain-containing protein [Micrococcales bacterium]|nr:DUF1905 domain-containing protein [Micrococcales bacterium]
MPTFTTTLLQTGNNVGIDVPEEIVTGFGAGKRVPVTVTLKGYTYSSTIAVMGGRYLVGVNAAHRAASGAGGGETLEVTLEHYSGERTVAVPEDLAAALEAAGARSAFDALSYTQRKEHVRQVEEAKAPETRARRIGRVVDGLRVS